MYIHVYIGVCVHFSIPEFQLLNKSTDFYNAWHDGYAIGRFPTVILFNFL
jgi:hypothetical protein